MSDPLIDISLKLGTILGKFESMEANQAIMVAEVKAITAEQITIRSDVVDMRDTVEGMKPFVDKAKKWEQRGIGAGMVLTGLGAIFGGAAVAFRDKLMTYFFWS